MPTSFDSSLTPPRFVVAGEALFDVFPAQNTPTGLSLDARLGGAPFNIAVGLARLGQSVAFLGGISTDSLGERLEAALSAEGVDTSLVKRVPAPTPLSMVGIDAQGQPQYSFHGHGCADREVDLAGPLPPSVEFLQVGSYAFITSPSGPSLCRLVEDFRHRGWVAFDPNVRLGVVPDPALWRERIDWMAPRCHLLKASAEDLTALYPNVSQDDLAQRWRAQGVIAVVITDGAVGSRAWTPAGALTIAAQPTTLVDTVGAGDSFQAAWLAGLARAHPETGTAQSLRAWPAERWQHVLDAAARAAAITCSRKGADLPRASELL